MNFGVIGEPCMDYIHREGEETQKRLGGILYSITSLSVISHGAHNVYPVMNLGYDEYDYIISFLKKFNNIIFDYINKVNHKVRVVQLYYKKSLRSIEEENLPGGIKKTYDREESSTEPIEHIEYELIHNALNNLDGLFINMISGVDITLETLKKVRVNFDKYIHFDSHNIVMRTYPDGRRLQEPIKDWHEWCTNCDTLQMNDSELNIISPEKLNEYDSAFKLLTTYGKGPKALIVTRGREGISLYRKKEKNEMGEKFTDLDRDDLNAVENPKFKDSTGCGDVFGSGFFYENITHNQSDYLAAANYANKLAGAKAGLMGVEEMINLKI